MKAWRVHRHAGPKDALQLDDIEAPVPGPGQVLVDVKSTVTNFNDIDFCYGRFPPVNPPLPFTLGQELGAI